MDARQLVLDSMTEEGLTVKQIARRVGIMAAPVLDWSDPESRHEWNSVRNAEAVVNRHVLNLVEMGLVSRFRPKSKRYRKPHYRRYK
jgi:hypothetical protein